MPQEFKPGCQRPSIKKQKKQEAPEKLVGIKEEENTMVKIGKPAPDFTASAYFQGKFMNITLSEYIGKWVLLCFYPGDFTFV